MQRRAKSRVVSRCVSWVLAFVGFALLVILHELGHFWAAKSVGMRVEKFSLFFPPTLFSKKRGETEYAIGAIPAGGYVKITGMNPDEDLPDEVRTRAYYSQPVWKRIVVIAAGPAMNLILAFVLMFVFFALIGPETSTSKVGVMETAYPAAKVLKSDDRVVAVDGQRGGPVVFQRQIAKHECPGGPPDGGMQGGRSPWRSRWCATGASGRSRSHRSTTPPRRTGRGRILAARDSASPTRPALVRRCRSASRSMCRPSSSGYITKATLSLPARLLDSEQRKEITGVVGSYERTRQTILYDLAQVVGILAIISLSLAIVNLFPFLPLDGGHIFWAIVEKVRGRPVPFSVMERAGVVGFMLVILIFLVGLSNDIDRLSGEGFQIR